MINEYINEHDKKLKKSYERDNYFFGLCFGFILLLVNSYFFLSRPINKSDYINLLFMIIGVVFILAATIYPNILSPIHSVFKKVLNFVGSLVFKIVLTIIYFIFVVPVGLIIKSKNKNNNVESNFTDYDNNIQNNRKGFLNLLQIFRIFSNEKYILMMPLIIILIIIGILLVFVQSSVIAPFIYTLF